MRIFITGATGYIGNAVAIAFSKAGHAVTGLVRSEEKGRQLRQHEITPIVGDLAKPASYLQAIKEAEVVVHCAFDPAGGAHTESSLVEAVFNEGQGSLKSPRAFLYTSGVWVIGNTGNHTADESSPCHPIELVKWRYSLEERLLKSSVNHFRVVVIRPGCVYGGSGSLTSLWFNGSNTGTVQIAGDGSNHWAMIHVDDLAQAYVLAAERELNGVVLNIIDDTRYTVKEMALAVAKAAGIEGKVKATTEKEAAQLYGVISEGLLVDQQVSNERTRRLLGWHPRHKGFIRDIDRYYQAWKAHSH